MLSTTTDAAGAHTSFPSPEHGLYNLGKYLQEQKYTFTTVTPLTHHYYNQRSAGAVAKDLRDIFGWNLPFLRSAVSEREFDLMYQAGILLREGEHWRSTVRFASFNGFLCLHSAYPTDATDAIFFGPDTYRFGRLIKSFSQAHTADIQRAVDLGCGTGAAAMLIAKAWQSAQVYAVDINPRALQMSAINARLAGLDNIQPVHSDLLHSLQGEFDLVVANPPYMLDTHQRAYRHGGGTLGAGLSEQIVEAALSRLAPGGSLLLYTGVAMVDGHDPFLQFLQRRLGHHSCMWQYQEMDPDVFGEELLKPAYRQVERIAAVELMLTLPSTT